MSKRESRSEYILREYKEAREKKNINNTDNIIKDLIERVNVLENKLRESED